jgi:hypothetical protein
VFGRANPEIPENLIDLIYGSGWPRTGVWCAMVNTKCEKKQPGTRPGCSISIYPEQLVSATKQVVDAKTHAIDIVLETKTIRD